MNHLLRAHAAWKALLSPSDLAIDATAGGGKDARVLADILSEGELAIFDIQEKALAQTQERLKGAPARIQLHRACHSTIGSVAWPRPPRLIVFNLGYFPSGNHLITTRVETTRLALEASMKLLTPPNGGFLSVTFYPGHPEGAREEQELLPLLSPHIVESYRGSSPLAPLWVLWKQPEK
jgi:hypothetical protein